MKIEWIRLKDKKPENMQWVIFIRDGKGVPERAQFQTSDQSYETNPLFGPSQKVDAGDMWWYFDVETWDEKISDEDDFFWIPDGEYIFEAIEPPATDRPSSPEADPEVVAKAVDDHS